MRKRVAGARRCAVAEHRGRRGGSDSWEWNAQYMRTVYDKCQICGIGRVDVGGIAADSLSDQPPAGQDQVSCVWRSRRSDAGMSG
jgi:hypothetical protein